MSNKEHPDEDYVITFGKYKNKKTLKQLPDDYLLFLWGDDGKGLYEGPIKRYIRDNLDAIKANVNRGKWYNKV